MLLAILSMMSLTPGTMSAAPPSHAEPALVWKTSGSVTFASVDGADVWLIEANGGVDAPKARLVRISSAGAEAVATFSAYAYWPAADKDYIYLVVDKDVVRVDKRAPHATKVLRKGEVWPVGVAVEWEYVYFTNQTTEGLDGGPPHGQPGSVARMKKGGGGLERLANKTARNLVLDADNVYFSSSVSICAVSKRGRAVRTLVADAGQTADLAIDGEWLLYTRTNGVSRYNTESGKIEALADGIDIPLFVAAGDGVAYAGANFAFQGAGKPPKPAEILRLRPGLAPERLWSGMNRLMTMVLAGGQLYFTVEGVDGTAGTSVLRIDVGR
jgi:hypothetical protein